MIVFARGLDLVENGHLVWSHSSITSAATAFLTVLGIPA